jgi:hypothetical protein
MSSEVIAWLAIVTVLNHPAFIPLANGIECWIV